MLSEHLAFPFLPTSNMWSLTLFILGLFAVLASPYLTGRRVSITHKKQGWRVALVNSRGDFQSNAEHLIRMGFSKVSVLSVIMDIKM